MDRLYLKSQAKQQIRGNIGVLFVITLIISIISTLSGLVLSQIPIVGNLISTFIIAPAFTLSITQIYLNITINKTPAVSDAFSGFNSFWTAFKVQFLAALFAFLWSLLLIIPGIIKSISYSMSMYVLAENNEKSALECINESKRITEGYKLDLFVLALSFIGWIFVGYITFGIAYIWILPYMQATFANAYVNIKGTNA